MRFVTYLGASCLAVSVGVLAGSAPAGAAPKRITGKLSKSGYTVVALAANGKANAARARGERFRLRPPARRVTLHLRAPHGKYAGPIVVGRAERGTIAVLGVRAGAELGRVMLRRGYAKVARKPPMKWIADGLNARARQGAPIGARRFGRVRSRRVSKPVPGDLDLDGVPDLLDIDDDGDLILDSFDRATRVRASTRQPDDEFADELNPISFLTLDLSQTANANHPVLEANIDSALKTFGILGIQLNDAFLPPDGELDCASPQSRTDPTLGGLVYCTRGGTGMVGDQPFPGEPGGPFDPDGDGFGSIRDPGTGCRPDGGCGGVGIQHGATSDQIGTGDLLILRASDRDRAALLKFAFATVPALYSIDDDGSGGDPPKQIAYPVSGLPPGGVCPPPGPPCTGPGIRGTGFPVTPRPNGDVVLTLTFWRPQRTPIEGETGPWIDMGGVSYEANLADVGRTCPQSSLSEDDPKLTPSGTRAGFTDTAQDQPADPSNRFTYTVNLTQCLEANGMASSFDEPGEEQGLELGGRAPNALDAAAQSVFFKRQ